jgi:hypothetical protein
MTSNCVTVTIPFRGTPENTVCPCGHPIVEHDVSKDGYQCRNAPCRCCVSSFEYATSATPLVECVCGSRTLDTFLHRNLQGGITGCWITLDEQGLARPGCAPDINTEGVVTRRNDRMLTVHTPRPTRTQYPSGALVRCACGSLTRVLTSNVNELVDPPTIDNPPDPAVAIGPTTCWLAIAEDGSPIAGCEPQDRTHEVLGRDYFNAIGNNRMTAKPRRPERTSYSFAAIVRCACGQLTRVLTSNVNELLEPPAATDPPDPAVPVGPTACWLAIADDGGPAEGCAPDERTWDVLGRARHIERPHADVVLEALDAPRPSAEARLEFLEIRAAGGSRKGKSKPAEPPPPSIEEDESPELSLFG